MIHHEQERGCCPAGCHGDTCPVHGHSSTQGESLEELAEIVRKDILKGEAMREEPRGEIKGSAQLTREDIKATHAEKPYNYDRDGSHTHCWNQEKPACGKPLEKHTQCCLCDTPYPTGTIYKTQERGMSYRPEPQPEWENGLKELAAKKVPFSQHSVTFGYKDLFDFISHLLDSERDVCRNKYENCPQCTGLRDEERARIVKIVKGMKKYSGGHNAAHTWIENGYCHGCQKQLTQKQLEEEFGWNAALTSLLDLISKEK